MKRINFAFQAKIREVILFFKNPPFKSILTNSVTNSMYYKLLLCSHCFPAVVIIYTPHHAFPLGSSPFSSWWCPAGTVQTWALHSDAHSSPALRLTAGRVEKPTGRGKPFNFCVFMECGYDPTIPANTLWMARLPSLKVWCPGAPSYPHQQRAFPFREPKKRSQTQTKHESRHSYSPGTRCLFSPKGFPTPALPSPHRP